jgi:hypothetical protein
MSWKKIKFMMWFRLVLSSAMLGSCWPMSATIISSLINLKNARPVVTNLENDEPTLNLTFKPHLPPHTKHHQKNLTPNLAILPPPPPPHHISSINLAFRTIHQS